MRKILAILCLSLVLSGCASKPYHLTKMEYSGITDKNGNTYNERYTLYFTKLDFAGRYEISINVSKETYEACTLEKNKEKDNGKD